jgi:DNA-binding MarR family transcriptional regulator
MYGVDDNRYNEYIGHLRLREEIHQTKPFGSLEEEVYVELQLTADRLLGEVTRELRAFGLSPAQYNVLRILRGAGTAGVTCGEIGGRMIHRDPDVTRLVDRLVAQGLAVRERDERDRRVVVTRATDEARELLRKVDPRLAALHQRRFAHVPPEKLRRLSSLLEELRDQEPDAPTTAVPRTAKERTK